MQAPTRFANWHFQHRSYGWREEVVVIQAVSYPKHLRSMYGSTLCVLGIEVMLMNINWSEYAKCCLWCILCAILVGIFNIALRKWIINWSIAEWVYKLLRIQDSFSSVCTVSITNGYFLENTITGLKSYIRQLPSAFWQTSTILWVIILRKQNTLKCFVI